jgi:general secretion pathway protein K
MKPRAQVQKGAALLLAMVILTLVTTLAAGMVWQQWRAVQVEAAERTRAQAAWILSGALDMGRVILRLDARTPGADHLDEPWATQLQESSLSSLLAQDRNNNVEGAPEAFLRGGIRDAQSRYNLRNLVDANQKIVEAEVAILARLCESAGLSPDTAQAIASGLLTAWHPDLAAGGEADDAPLVPHTVEQLTWLGLSPATVKGLQRYVTLLPEPTPVNINTASAEVLAGILPGLDAGSAERLVKRRPFKNVQEARAFIPGNEPIDPKRVDVASRYFEISGQLRMEGRTVEERLLVVRKNREITALSRSRQSVQGGTP